MDPNSNEFMELLRSIVTELRAMNAKEARESGRGSSRMGMNCQIHFRPGLPHPKKAA